MQEWIIAMLVISVLLILRDMAKTIFSEMKKSAATLAYDQHPQKEKMQRYADSFQKLADSFYGLPYRKDYLSSSEVDAMVTEVQEGLSSAPDLLDSTFCPVLSERLSSDSRPGRK